MASRGKKLADLINGNIASSDNATNSSMTSIAQLSSRKASGSVDIVSTVFLFGPIPLLALWALCSNMVNIAAFSKMPKSSGVNASFLILCVSDGIVAVFLLIKSFTQISLSLISPLSTSRSLLLLTFKLSLVALNFPLSTSLASTTMIAVIRCCCVAMPFKARNLFTAGRQSLAVATCSLAMSSIYIYSAAFMKLQLRQTRNNVTSLVITMESGVLVAVDIMRNVIFFLCFSIVLLSVVILIAALNKTKKFRSQAIESFSKTPQHQPMSALSREAQVTKSVLLVLIIFSVCNFPYALFSILRQIRIASGIYSSLQSIIGLITTACLELNIGLNFFVYFFCNKTFRNVVMFYCHCK